MLEQEMRQNSAQDVWVARVRGVSQARASLSRFACNHSITKHKLVNSRHPCEHANEQEGQGTILCTII